MHILFVEDHVDLAEAIIVHLTRAGHNVDWIASGLEASRHVLLAEWDVIILDIQLPEKSGQDILQELRQKQIKTPVLVITANPEIENKVDLLDTGADDYLVKPFDLRELDARLRALIRRQAGQISSTLELGNVRIDFANPKVEIQGQLLDLNRREFRLLEIFCSKLEQVIPKERLMAQLFQAESDVSLNALELQVSRLRKKLEGASLQIVTVHGVGYLARLDANEH